MLDCHTHTLTLTLTLTHTSLHTCRWEYDVANPAFQKRLAEGKTPDYYKVSSLT